jgi:scyllo-inositol 2-dehydrogenase (NADP+)
MEENTGVIRAGILGYGFAGRGFHAYLLRFEPRIRLTAVASRDAGRRAAAERDYGVPTYETLQQLLADPQIDLVIVATPHDVHAEQVIQSLDAGKHVVVDKVMCLTTDEADAMIAARERSGKLLSVFHNRRWDGDYLTIRRALDNDLLGRLLLFEIGSWRYGAPRNWRSRRDEVGTIMHDWGAHFVDQALQLGDAPVTSLRARAQHDWPQIDVESYIGVDITFANGILGRVEVSNKARLGKPHWYLVGTRGGLMKEGVDPQEAAMLRGDIDAAREDPAHYARVQSEQNGLVSDMRLTTLAGNWKEYYRNIADALLDGKELVVTAEQVRRVVGLLEAVQQSAATGELIQFAGEGL